MANSTSPTGQAKASQPGVSCPPTKLRSMLKNQSPLPLSPPEENQTVSSSVVRGAVYAVTSAAAVLGALAKRSRKAGDRGDRPPTQRRQSMQGQQQAGDQRQPSPVETESSSKSSSLTHRGELVWNALRAAGNPTTAVFVALVVLCVLLLLGLLGYMLFAPARPKMGGAGLRGPKVTADPDETSQWKLPPIDRRKAPSTAVPATTPPENRTSESTGTGLHRAATVQDTSVMA